VFMDGTYWKYSRSKVNEDFKFSMKWVNLIYFFLLYGIWG
jgi:hypothetical protein